MKLPAPNSVWPSSIASVVDLAEVAKVEQEAKIEGRNMTMAFAPLKRLPRRAVVDNSRSKNEV